MNARASPTTPTGKKLVQPSGIGWWLFALAMTPLTFLIGLSVFDGLPEGNTRLGWLFLLGFAVWPLLSQAVDLGLWHLREHLNRPAWWTERAQANLGNAPFFALILAACLVYKDAAGWRYIAEIGLYAFLLLIPVFLYLSAVDWLWGRIKRVWISRRG